MAPTSGEPPAFRGFLRKLRESRLVDRFGRSIAEAAGYG